MDNAYQHALRHILHKIVPLYLDYASLIAQEENSEILQPIRVLLSARPDISGM